MIWRSGRLTQRTSELVEQEEQDEREEDKRVEQPLAGAIQLAHDGRFVAHDELRERLAIPRGQGPGECDEAVLFVVYILARAASAARRA